MTLHPFPSLSLPHTESTLRLRQQSPPSKLLHYERCPRCAEEGRDTSEDNLGVYDDGHAYCFSCEYYRSPEAKELPQDQGYSYQYVPWRGISASTYETFNVLAKVDATGRPISVGFRYPNGDIKVRLIDKKDFYWVKRDQNTPLKAGLFGSDRFQAGSNQALIITEGELDAASFWQVLKVPSVSVRSSSSSVADCNVDRSWCQSFDRIYLAFDGDAAGQDALHRVAPLFDPRRLYHIKFDARRKDANEFLQNGEEEDLRQLFWNSKRYLPESIISSFSDFKKILDETPVKGIPYPWPTITDMTYGIRTGESVLITAQEGIGKTEVMHAILYQILRATDHNVGAVFLEELKPRLLQSIAGLHLRAPVHLPDAGYSPDQIYDALKEAIQRDDRCYVLNHFGSDDPDILLDRVRYLAVGCGCRVILLDHIGMVVSGVSDLADERRKLDYLITRLETMVKELDFALILVSHVNDEGLTRSSRYISKIADIRVDLSRDLLHPDPVERNVTYLKISKNRFSGKTGGAGRIYFNPVTHVYQEIPDGQAPEVGTLVGQNANDNMVTKKIEAA